MQKIGIRKRIPIFGGHEGDRTLDLTDANRTLSQLSYTPGYLILLDFGRNYYSIFRIFVKIKILIDKMENL